MTESWASSFSCSIPGAQVGSATSETEAGLSMAGRHGVGGWGAWKASQGIGSQKPRAGIRQRSPKSGMAIEPLERGKKLEVSHVRDQSGAEKSGEAQGWVIAAAVVVGCQSGLLNCIPQ